MLYFYYNIIGMPAQRMEWSGVVMWPLGHFHPPVPKPRSSDLGHVACSELHLLNRGAVPRKPIGVAGTYSGVRVQTYPCPVEAPASS